MRWPATNRAGRRSRSAGRLIGRGLRCLSLALGLALPLGLAAPPAGAVPVLEGDDHTVNVDGSLKAYVFAIYLANYPDILLQQLGVSTSAPWGGMGMADLRLKLEGEHHEKYKWKLHFRSQPFLSTFPGALSSLSMAGGAHPARSLPLEVVAPDGAQFNWRHEVDLAMVSMRFGPVDVIIGRQPISFGVGFVWMPADLVGTFSPTEIDGEYKPGVDAIRVNFALGQFTELAVVAAVGGPHCAARNALDPDDRTKTLPDGRTCSPGAARFSVQHSVLLARFRTNVKQWDFGVLAGWVRGDVVAGVFATGTVKRFRIRSEVVYTWDVEEDAADPATGLTYAGSGNADGRDDHFARAVLGVDYKFDTKNLLTVLAEVYYNGFGRTDPKDYLQLSAKPRMAEFGEVFNMGVLYAALGVNWEPHHKLPLSLVVMGNLLDPSMLIQTSITYKVGDESIIVAGAMIPIGHRPRFDLGDPDAFNGLVVRSEYGLFPYVFYIQWKNYF